MYCHLLHIAAGVVQCNTLQSLHLQGDRTMKKGTKKTEKKDRHLRRAVTFRLADDMLAALDSLAETTRRSKTTELEIALEAHLAKAGLWPPKS